MSYKILNPESDNPTYVFNDFLGFVMLCIRLKPAYTLRTYLYAVVGWVIGATMGISLVEKITLKWALTQVSLLLLILSICTAITLWSLRKEWDYLRSSNLVRKVPRE